MDTTQDIKQLFVNNLGNRITPELATGMINAIVQLIPVIKEVDKLPEKKDK